MTLSSILGWGMILSPENGAGSLRSGSGLSSFSHVPKVPGTLFFLQSRSIWEIIVCVLLRHLWTLPSFSKDSATHIAIGENRTGSHFLAWKHELQSLRTEFFPSISNCRFSES